MAGLKRSASQISSLARKLVSKCKYKYIEFILLLAEKRRDGGLILDWWLFRVCFCGRTCRLGPLAR
jgi:hypothetical protein